MGWYGWNGLGSFGWIGMLGMLVLWFGLVALVVWAISRAVVVRGPVVSGGPPEDSAGRILSERLARGEITDVEYQQAKDVLSGKAR